MNDSSVDRNEELERLLGAKTSSRVFGSTGLWLIGAGVLALVAFGYWFLRTGNNAHVPRYQTEAVARGNLVMTVSATGNLQPTNKVDVGSELSGTIESVFVDDNDKVKKGQVLARLDVSKLNDQVAKSGAALASAQAKVLQAGATVKESRANLERLREVAHLSGGKVPSRAELETAEAVLARGLADEASARAAVAEAQASLSSDETNLRKAAIRSPIDGVVLARKVDPGQTVAASFQAPVLFSLAEDLAQMELQVDVDEADVGHVREGQSAVFNVDAYPGRQYPSRITRVGYGSQTKEGVISYLTVLAVNNDDLSLRPGMTATAEITTATRENVLLVPNAALRFAPPAISDAGKKPRTGLVGSLLPRPPARQPSKASGTTPNKGGAQSVWIVRNGEPAPITVTVGVSNGRFTEVTGGELEAGMEVIIESLAAPK